MSPAPPLKYALDDEPGITRRRAGKGFCYRGLDGRPVDSKTRKRIERLAIPPAWTDVWICPNPDGHIQATGRDAKGRKQYIYHPGWREWREENKFLRILDFASALPRLRERVARDLSERKLTRSLALAAAVRVLERTLMRIGNDEYARQNRSYGLTTLLEKHVENSGSHVRFSFRGKQGKPFEAEINDRRVAAVLRRLEGLPGQHLFQFLDADGECHRITSDDINAYIREATGGDFTAKDFRTWAATVLAVLQLLRLEEPTSETAAKRNISQAVKQVAQRLGNTPAVCRSSYIHPEVMESCRDGTLAKLSAKLEDANEEDVPGLEANEKTVLRFLKRRANGNKPTQEKPAPLKQQLAQSLDAAAAE